MTYQRLKELDEAQWQWSEDYAVMAPTDEQKVELKSMRAEEDESLERLGLPLSWVHNQHELGWPCLKEGKGTSVGNG